MTGCLNGGSCRFDKKNETFTCSCKLPWSGDSCEVKHVKGKPSIYLFLFYVRLPDDSWTAIEKTLEPPKNCHGKSSLIHT